MFGTMIDTGLKFYAVPFTHTIHLPLPLIQEEQLSVTGERMCTKYW